MTRPTHRAERLDSGRVVVVGGGVAGMAAAIRLAERGHRVWVFDPASRAGGLAGGFQVGGTSVEKFYHHIFRSDRVAVRWIEELGLEDKLEYLPASMGFFIRGQIYPFGTPLSVLRFPPLPLRDRIRLGLRVRALSQTPTAERFENVTAMGWLASRASQAELRGFWIPLLEAKFGADRDIVSMAWLWARFRARLGGSTLGGESLGYLRGGFQQLGDRLADEARAKGVSVHMGTRVTGLDIEDGATVGVRLDAAESLATDSVVWTPSLNVLAKAVPELPDQYRTKCANVMYHTAVVVVVELAATALRYYWTTVGDRDLPFTVAVEHTRLVPPTDYDNKTIVYLGRYARADQPILKLSDAAIGSMFLTAAAKAFGPEFSRPLNMHVFRAPAAQPVVPPGWAVARPSMQTGIRGLVTANMAQIYPWDRGINYSLELGEAAAAAVSKGFEAQK